jgi:ribulose-5-phosphate 4-epimerase/fuculose-1-phosphate aldolase
VTNAHTELCQTAQSFFDRGYAFGSTGNLSIREGDGIWITPTGMPLHSLTPDRLAHVSLDGTVHGEVRPSKELPFHLGIYRRRPEARAIVHLHSTYSVALSCLPSITEADPMPALTPYYFMRVAPLGIVPYFRPGSAELAQAVEDKAPGHNCLLLLNHGLITIGEEWNEAVDRAEELEETAKLYFILRGGPCRELNQAELDDLVRAFPRKSR